MSRPKRNGIALVPKPATDVAVLTEVDLADIDRLIESGELSSDSMVSLQGSSTVAADDVRAALRERKMVAVDGDAVLMEQEFLPAVPVSQLHPSPWNPRRNVDGVQLQHMADSLKRDGQIQPVIARPRFVDGVQDGYELAGGHRRRLAALLAGLPTLSVMVRNYDDKQFREVLSIDNDHVEGVHPLDQALGYQQLLDFCGYNVSTLADRLSRGETYVRERLQLLQLTVASREAFLQQRMSKSVAVELSKLNAEQQHTALRQLFNLNVEALNKAAAAAELLDQAADSDDESLVEEVLKAPDEDSFAQGGSYNSRLQKFEARVQAVSLGEIRSFVQEQFKLDLAKAPWDLADAELLPAAGACIACPKRTGAQGALFAETLGDRDACCDGACYEQKRDALLTRRRIELAASEPEFVQISSRFTGNNIAADTLPRDKYEFVKANVKGAKKALVVDGEDVADVKFVIEKTDTPDTGAPTKSKKQREREAQERIAAKEAKQVAAFKRDRAQASRNAVVNTIIAKITPTHVSSTVFMRWLFTVLLEVEDHSVRRAFHELAVALGFTQPNNSHSFSPDELARWARGKVSVDLTAAVIRALLGTDCDASLTAKPTHVNTLAEIVKVNVSVVGKRAAEAFDKEQRALKKAG